MVCFVYDRQFLSQFHGAVNKLRQTKQFTIGTLRQLPKRCCSCPEKRKDMANAEAESRLTSLDFDTLRLICIHLELKQCINTGVSPSSSHIPDYIILPFPSACQSGKHTMMADQFNKQHYDQLLLLQQIHRVHFQFVTSNTSEELLNHVIRYQYDLVTKSSNYLEAKQVVNGLWVYFPNDFDHQSNNPYQ